jgi:hypothetical protein
MVRLSGEVWWDVKVVTSQTEGKEGDESTKAGCRESISAPCRHRTSILDTSFKTCSGVPSVDI